MQAVGVALSVAVALLLSHAAGQTAALPADLDIERFLKNGTVVQSRRIGEGITESVRATLTDGTLTHDAHVQNVDVSQAEYRTKTGVEKDFRDSWEFNVAAYRIDRLLDLRIVPVSVERTWNGRAAAFTWWIDDVLVDERARIAKQMRAPDLNCWFDASQALRLLDILIENTDRNLGNTIYDRQWRLWAIDHTRAFRRSKQPKDLHELTRIDRQVLERLKKIDFVVLKHQIGRFVEDAGIRALLARRDRIVDHIKDLGDKALFDRRDPAAGCATPPDIR